MPDPITEHIRHLEQCLADRRQRPELHRHQLAVLEEQLALARTAGSCSEHAPAFALARAEWLDRYRNAMGVHRALHNQRKLRAMELCYEAARHARDTEDFQVRMREHAAQIAALEQAVDEAVPSLLSMMLALLDWLTTSSVEAQQQALVVLHAHWRVIRAVDPGCTWQRICEDPLYRWRLPFRDEPLAILGKLFEAALGPHAYADTGPVQPAQTLGLPLAAPTLAPMPPTVQAAAHAYHLSYEALDRSDPSQRELMGLCERIFAIEASAASVPEFMRMLAVERIPCRLARTPHLVLARTVLDHCQGMSQPQLEHHYTALVAALERSVTPTEVEHELTLAREYLAVEATWNELLLQFALRPVRLAMAYEIAPDPAGREALQRSSWLVHALFGMPVDALLATPRIWDFFCRMLFERGQIGADNAMRPGAFLGEAGLMLAQGAIGMAYEYAAAEAGRRPSITAQELSSLFEQPRFATADQMLAHVSSIVREAMNGMAAPSTPWAESQPELSLWGSPVRLGELMDALVAPPRPVARHQDGTPGNPGIV